MSIHILDCKGKPSADIQKEMRTLLLPDLNYSKELTSLNTLSDDRLILHVTKQPLKAW